MRTSLGFLAFLVFSALGVVAIAERQQSSQAVAAPAKAAKLAVPHNHQIDYPGFVRLTTDLEQVRAKRRVPIKQFKKMAQDKHTIILDTRSKAAFDEVHVAGAKHLNFSDFTAPKLAKVIPNKNTRILIYCNNNFDAPNVPVFLSKSAPLALNIPTFINLHGYGYENVYELADVLKLDDPRVDLAGTKKSLPLAAR